MILATRQAAPLRFLLGVATIWVIARGAVLTGWTPGAIGTPAAALLGGDPAAAAAVRQSPGETIVSQRHRPPVRGAAEPARLTSASPKPQTPAKSAREVAIVFKVEEPLPRKARSIGAAAQTPLAAITTPPERSGSRWSGSAWAFARGGGHGRALSPDGQIGGGQAGARVLYRVAGGLAVAARVSRTIGGPDQSEAALGLDWQPVPRLPIHLLVDRRIGLDGGGRSAWALGAAGGVYAVPLAPGWRLDGYGEAGLVGAHARDLYADGAVRAGRALSLGDRGATLTLGLGVWGAAQPGAARVDAGPSAVLRVPIEGRTISGALDYRARVAGDARPHSGLALTVGVDF